MRNTRLAVLVFTIKLCGELRPEAAGSFFELSFRPRQVPQYGMKSLGTDEKKREHEDEKEFRAYERLILVVLSTSSPGPRPQW